MTLEEMSVAIEKLTTSVNLSPVQIAAELLNLIIGVDDYLCESYEEEYTFNCIRQKYEECFNTHKHVFINSEVQTFLKQHAINIIVAESEYNNKIEAAQVFIACYKDLTGIDLNVQELLGAIDGQNLTE